MSIRCSLSRTLSALFRNDLFVILCVIFARGCGGNFGMVNILTLGNVPDADTSGCIIVFLVKLYKLHTNKLLWNAYFPRKYVLKKPAIHRITTLCTQFGRSHEIESNLKFNSTCPITQCPMRSRIGILAITVRLVANGSQHLIGPNWMHARPQRAQWGLYNFRKNACQFIDSCVGPQAAAAPAAA